MKKKIAILCGGPSNEHEVSQNSARNIIENIDREMFDVIEVYISKEGLFNIEGILFETNEAIKKLKDIYDVVFPVLHGSFGEDGELQKVLEQERIAFIGSGSKSSSQTIDKNVSNNLFKKNGLIIPESQIISKEDSLILITYPIIIKPIDEGSSMGLYKCESEKDYISLKEELFQSHKEMLVQEYVIGREFTCGVIEVNKENIALPVSEIILTSSELFNYETKYVAGKCEEITPANISEELMKRIQNVAVRCHDILGCKSISRTDVIVKENTIYVLETNTLPGMTQTSFIPAQIKVHGMDMKELITRLIQSAIS